MTDTEARGIHARIDELATHMGNIAGDVKVIATACERLGTVVDGNGTEGLVTRVTVLEESRKQSSKRNALLDGLIGSAVAATIAATIAGLVVAFFIG